MAEEKIIKKIEIHLPGGTLLATLVVFESGKVAPVQTEEETPSEGKGNGGKQGDALMSDAQKRYLFRLLADQGIENDAAHDELKNRFKVKSLTEVSKVDASRENPLNLFESTS